MPDAGWLEYEVTRRDLLRVAKFLRRRQVARTHRSRPARWALGLIAVLLVILLLSSLALTLAHGGLGWTERVFANALLGWLIQALLVVGALYLVVYLSLPRLTAWAGARRRDVLGPRKLRIDEQGVHVVTAHLTSTVVWSGIESIETDDEDLYLFLDRDQALVIPSRAFAAKSTRETFLEQCRQRQSGGAGAPRP